MQNLNLDFISTLDKEPAVPVDSETISKCRKTTERSSNNLDSFNFKPSTRYIYRGSLTVQTKFRFSKNHVMPIPNRWC